MQNQTNFRLKTDGLSAYIAVLILSALLLPRAIFANEAIAKLDRNVIGEHDTVNLTYTINGTTSPPEPDFNVLNKNFEILRNSQSTSITSTNGRNSMLTQWSLTLAPRRAGDLIIPPIPAGNMRSQPLKLAVQQATQKQAGDPPAEIFLEAEASSDAAYVQSQITYNLKLFHSVPLISGQLSEPTVAKASIQQIGDTIEYQTQRQNRTYRVIERRYVIFPETAGTLTIPAITFTGQVPAPRNNRRNRNSVFDNFFSNQGRTVRHRSNAVSIEVKPPPAAFQGDWWLPAQAIEISQSWSPNPPVFKVGEPVTRTIMLRAKGLTDDQLPELRLPEVQSLRAYPDQAQTETQTDGQALYAVRREKIAIVPGQAGQYTLPAVRVPWWDTLNEKMQYAELPEQVIKVQAPPVTANENAEMSTTPATAEQSSLMETNLNPPTVVQTPGFWPWLSVFLAIGWMLTLGGWWWSRSHATHTESKNETSIQSGPTLKVARKELEQACLANDPQRAQQALLNWSRAYWPNALVASLGHVAARLNQPKASELLSALDATLYHSDKVNWQGAEFWKELAPCLAQAGKTSAKNTDADDYNLRPLYPHALKS
ncbi:MAG: BatD family protein [Pseudomonadota bacterium]